MPGLSAYWHTLRHLKAVQLYGRLWYRMYRPYRVLRPAPPCRIAVTEFAEPCRRSASLIRAEQFEFLNESGVVNKAADWNDPSKSPLWLYNLHYFDDLNAVGFADRSKWHHPLLHRWFVENPIGRGVGWESYPASLRIVNWIKWAIAGNDPTNDVITSLAVQTRWLRQRLEYHLLGNHLLANAKALVFAGLFFEGSEARSWYKKGTKLLLRELPEQVLADGGHFERSPMYHLIVLEDLLDLINLHRTYGRVYPSDWDQFATRMLNWSRLMRHPDEAIPFFNDAAKGVASEPSNVEAYARRLGIVVPQAKKAAVHHLVDSGYARLERNNAVLLIDMAPVGPDYLPGHAHADTLSFELSLSERRIIVNGGTSVYGGGKERVRQRSTVAHSTVVIDGVNSSEVWGGFRVARRANIIEASVWEEGDSCGAVGAHDGYVRLPGKPRHRRSWTLQSGGLRITDEISGDGVHQAEIMFPLAPGLRADVRKDGGLDIFDEDTGAPVLSLSPGSNVETLVEPSTWHPEFGLAIDTWRLRLRLHGKLPLSHATFFRWDI